MTEHPHGIPESNTEKSDSTHLRISTKFKQTITLYQVCIHVLSLSLIQYFKKAIVPIYRLAKSSSEQFLLFQSS